MAKVVKKLQGVTRKRRTNRDLFLDKLKKLSSEDSPLITNQLLRDELKWDDAKYKLVKGQLLDEGLIISGKGHGGKVGLSYGEGSSPLSVFVSYSHADEDLKNQLIKHLNPLKKMGLISEWNDRKLVAGDEWAQEISKNLESASIVILLISIDFINSEYCYDIELERALERHDAGEATVVPVILRSCMWQHMPFAKLQALPKDGVAISSWPDLDSAFANVAEGIKIKAEEIMADV